MAVGAGTQTLLIIGLRVLIHAEGAFGHVWWAFVLAAEDDEGLIRVIAPR